MEERCLHPRAGTRSLSSPRGSNQPPLSVRPRASRRAFSHIRKAPLEGLSRSTRRESHRHSKSALFFFQEPANRSHLRFPAYPLVPLQPPPASPPAKPPLRVPFLAMSRHNLAPTGKFDPRHSWALQDRSPDQACKARSFRHRLTVNLVVPFISAPELSWILQLHSFLRNSHARGAFKVRGVR